MYRLSCSKSTPKDRNLTSGRCCVLGEVAPWPADCLLCTTMKHAVDRPY